MYVYFSVSNAFILIKPQLARRASEKLPTVNIKMTAHVNSSGIISGSQLLFVNSIFVCENQYSFGN